jgi:hypothetical protein
MNDDDFDALVNRVRSGRLPRRKKPLSLLALNDQLGNAVERYHDKFTPEERDLVGRILQALEEIEDGRR